MQSVAATVLDRRGKHVEDGRPIAVQVEEDGTAPQIVIDTGEDVGADRFEQRVAWRDSFERGIGR